MAVFDVWAPRAANVELVLRDSRMRMSPLERGWWRAEAEASPGDVYAFSLDGGPPRPDPRSADQPDGVHGSSGIVDHGAYGWRFPSFRAANLSSAVIYELHVGTFTPEGTLDAAIGKLDHLVDLGVTHVNVMPLNSFEGERGWGYDGVAWYAPHRPYCGPGGPDAVKRFVDACHERGLAAVLDVVYNHLGPSGNYLDEFGPYFSGAYSTPWGPSINLDDGHSDIVRRFICDSALMWLRDYRFDGLRVDAVHAFHDRSAIHLLEQLRTEVRELERASGRPLVVIAESDLNDPRVVTPREAGGQGCDAQWSDDFHHALHALLTKEERGYYADFGRIGHLAKALENGYVYDGRYSGFRQRVHGKTPRGLTSDRFLGYIQNHDQVGNRATGDRLTASCSDQQLKTAAALVILGPFVPMLFQGEEWGATSPFQFFTDFGDEGLADAVRNGRRGEFEAFGWDRSEIPDPQDPATFARSKLPWGELEEPRGADMLAWYRDLIAVRKRTAGVTARPLERTRVDLDEDERWLAMRNGNAIVVCSFAESGVEPVHHIPIGGLLEPGDGALKFAIGSDASCALAGTRASVPARGCLVAAIVPAVHPRAG